MLRQHLSRSASLASSTPRVSWHLLPSLRTFTRFPTHPLSLSPFLVFSPQPLCTFLARFFLPHSHTPLSLPLLLLSSHPLCFLPRTAAMAYDSPTLSSLSKVRPASTGSQSRPHLPPRSCRPPASRQRPATTGNYRRVASGLYQRHNPISIFRAG